MSKTLWILLPAMVFSFATQKLAAQEVCLLNGKSISSQTINISSEDSVITYQTPKGKTRRIDYEDVFSVTDKSGKKTILYQPSTLSSFTVEQMQSFVNGRNDAEKQYNPKWIMPLGVVAGGASVAVLPLIGFPSAYAPVGVAAYTAPVSSVRKDKLVVDEKYKNDEFYKDGYRKAVGEKRMKKALKGSIIGVAVGFAIRSFF